MVKHRVERGHRLLKDHRDPRAADLAHFVFGQLGEDRRLRLPLRVHHDLPAGDSAGRGDQPDDRHRGHAFAAAAFADQAERFAARNAQRDIIDRADHALVGVEIGLQVLDIDERVGHV